MKNKPGYYLAALAALLLLIVIFGTHAKAPKGPLQKMRESIDAFDAACSQACAGEAAITALVPANTTLYTTAEAICMRRENNIACARCECDVEAGVSRFFPAEQEIACTLSGTPLHLDC